jgi:hypothetical protein
MMGLRHVNQTTVTVLTGKWSGWSLPRWHSRRSTAVSQAGHHVIQREQVERAHNRCPTGAQSCVESSLVMLWMIALSA